MARITRLGIMVLFMYNEGYVLLLNETFGDSFNQNK